MLHLPSIFVALALVCNGRPIFSNYDQNEILKLDSTLCIFSELPWKSVCLPFISIRAVSNRTRPKVSQGVFVLMTKNVFVPVKLIDSVNTYSRISTVPQVSKVSERARERIEQAKRA